MKKMICIIGCLIAGGLAFAQHIHDADGCDCPSCKEKGATKFTLPGLEGLNRTESCEEEHDHSAHEEHAAHASCEGHDHAAHDHAAHEHQAEASAHDEHEGHEHDLGCSGHGHEEEGGLEVSPDIAKKIGIEMNAATGGTISKSVVFPAEINLNRDRAAAVSARYPSVIRQVFVEIGDRVKKGDILASLENREMLSVYTVSAPLDGQVVAKSASVGEVAGEDRVLFEVADLSSVWVDISVYPQYQHRVEKGMAVEFVARDGHIARGTIAYVSPLISKETRTFTARCVLKGAREDFTPGAFVRARIVTESVEVPVRVERGAVQVVNGQAVVFIKSEHGFETRDVVLGERGDRFVEIRQGLSAGEDYVVAGAFTLKAEMVTSGMDPHAGHGH